MSLFVSAKRVRGAQLIFAVGANKDLIGQPAHLAGETGRDSALLTTKMGGEVRLAPARPCAPRLNRDRDSGRQAETGRDPEAHSACAESTNQARRARASRLRARGKWVGVERARGNNAAWGGRIWS